VPLDQLGQRLAVAGAERVEQLLIGPFHRGRSVARRGPECAAGESFCAGRTPTGG
jgi:hypothetical protein